METTPATGADIAERVAWERRRFEASLSRRLVSLDAESPGDVSDSAALP